VLFWCIDISAFGIGKPFPALEYGLHKDQRLLILSSNAKRGDPKAAPSKTLTRCAEESADDASYFAERTVNASAECYERRDNRNGNNGEYDCVLSHRLSLFAVVQTSKQVIQHWDTPGFCISSDKGRTERHTTAIVRKARSLE
jgi:hypothetical protein